MKTTLSHSEAGAQWWRSAIIYQIYPRSFADGNGDGMGDLQGIQARLPELRDLGVDAVWFSPFFKSPQKDAGYDVSDYMDIDPLFGTLSDFDHMLSEARELGLRVIVDLVPNHSSTEHVHFQAALKAAKGSAERDLYIFRDGKGGNGELPPNNWESVFGGPAWTRITEPDGAPGQWYLHLFDSSQPDWNWDNPAVPEMFDEIMRFWLDRGVDGFRIDVAHSMIKAAGLPDIEISEGEDKHLMEDHPHWSRDEVHVINRRFRSILDEYDDRAMCAEAFVLPLNRMAKWVRSDEYHQCFNFGYLQTHWEADKQRAVIDESLQAFSEVGAPSTWVLSNHDAVRHTSRFGYEKGVNTWGDGIGPDSPQPDEALGLRRARSASAMMLALPGAAYIYQGEELGLPEHTTIEPKFREDPTFARTGGERVGRDGCRVPIPWEQDKPSYGFGETDLPWLPQPESFARYARDVQKGQPGSTLELYKLALKLRKEFDLGNGSLSWVEELSNDNALAFENNGVLVITNFSGGTTKLPAGELLLSTQVGLAAQGELEQDETAWIKI